MFTPLITHNSDGAALAAPVNAARCNGAVYKPRTIDDLRIKDDRLRAVIEGTGHLLFDGGMGTMLQAAGMKAGALDLEKEAILQNYRGRQNMGFTLDGLKITQRVYVFGQGDKEALAARFAKDVCNPAIHNWTIA